MSEDEFRQALNRANRENNLLFVSDGKDRFIALGLDSGRQVAIMHGNAERPLSEIFEI